jgi:hypothetical protein
VRAINLSLEAEFRSLLESDRERGAVVLTRVKKINLTHYAKIIGCSKDTLKQFNALVNEYDDGFRLDSTESQLRELLERDFESGYPMYRGRISRNYYANLIGCSRSAISRFASIFSDFEARASIVPLGDRLHEMLKRDARDGALVVASDGRILRSHYAAELKVFPSYIERYNGVFSQFEDVVAPTLIPPVCDRGVKLFKLLERDFLESSVVLQKWRKVDRGYYLRAIGPISQVDAKFSRMFDYYDHRLFQMKADSLTVSIQRDIETGTVAVSFRGAINRRHYTDIVGIPRVDLPAFAPIFEKFDEEMSNRGPVTESKLRGLIDEDLARGELVTSRGGKISRSHYAEKLGVTQPNMTRFVSVFAEYEKEHRISTGPERRLTEMRKWISGAFASRELALRDGKIDRKAFQTHFKLKGGTFLTRSAKIRELLEEFDARVKSEGYLPKVDDEELDRVVAHLQGRPELNRDRLTVNRVALGKRLGIPLPRLKRGVVDRVIRRREAEILRQAEESVIDPFVQGRVFVFSELQDPWSRHFLENVGEAFKLYASGQVDSKQVYLKLFDALAWIGADTSNHSAAAVAEANASGRICDLDNWEEALHSYRDHLISGIAARSASKSGVDGTIKALRRALAALEARQVVPRLSANLRGVKFARRLTKHVPSIAETGTRCSSDSAVRKEIETRLGELSGLLVDDWEAGDLPAFVEALEAEMQLVGELPDDPVEAIKRALERRLDALNQAASKLVEVGMQQYDRGRTLVGNAKCDSKAFLTDYFSANLSRTEKRELLRAAFPDPSTGETAMANLLSMVETEFSGIPPRGQHSEFGQFFAKRYLELGGRDAIDPFLFPDNDSVCAVLVLYLLDSGSNVAVGRTLDRDCLEATDIEDHTQITGIKAKADGKPIYQTLPIDSPSVKAIKWLVRAGSALKRVSGKDSDRLFLTLRGDCAEMLTEHAFRDWFGRFSRNIDGLAGLVLTPRMIRPSILLRAALANEGRIAVGMAIGQHGADVSSGYQAKWATRRLYDVQVRRYQGDLETLIIVNAADVASKLGISAEDMRGRLASLRESGLGTFCKNHLGRPGAEGRACPTMDCWNDCPQLLIVAEVEAIASLQIWQASLRAVQPAWERDRPERWDQVWLPWLVLTDVVEEKMTRGLISVWEAARRHVEMVTSAPGFVAPQPW